MIFERTDGILARGTMVALLALLCACGGNQQARETPEEDKITDNLQISDFANSLRTAPDEFSVITKRPLEMPGDFAALPVPDPGRRSTRDPDPQADARAALSFDPAPAGTATTVVAPAAPSAVEAAILSAAGPADPNIRATLAAEQASYDSEQNLYVLDRIFPTLRTARGDDNPDIIDAEAERLRLLEAGIGPRQTATAPLAPAQPVAVIAPAPVAAPASTIVVPEAATPVPELIYLSE